MSVRGIGVNNGDEYYTPKWLVQIFGKFDYDPATTKEKAKDFLIDNFDTIDTNGLTSNWGQYKRIWINPPFSLKYEFLKKAVDTYLKHNNDIYIVIPITALTTKRFESTSFKGKLYIPNGRIQFEPPSKVSSRSASVGSIVLKPGIENKIQYFSLNKGVIINDN